MIGLYDVLQSLLTGIASSTIVVLLFYNLRPNVKISEQISDYTVDGVRRFGFKMINYSRFNLMDVRISLEIVTPTSIPKGQIYSAEKIKLVSNEFFIVGKFRKNDKDADYAFRVKTLEDIRSIWNKDGQYLRLSVVGRHALSGFYGVFQQRYYTFGDIICGSHQFGNSLDIRPVD